MASSSAIAPGPPPPSSPTPPSSPASSSSPTPPSSPSLTALLLRRDNVNPADESTWDLVSLPELPGLPPRMPPLEVDGHDSLTLPALRAYIAAQPLGDCPLRDRWVRARWVRARALQFIRGFRLIRRISAFTDAQDDLDVDFVPSRSASPSLFEDLAATLHPDTLQPGEVHLYVPSDAPPPPDFPGPAMVLEPGEVWEGDPFPYILDSLSRSELPGYLGAQSPPPSPQATPLPSPAPEEPPILAPTPSRFQNRPRLHWDPSYDWTVPYGSATACTGAWEFQTPSRSASPARMPTRSPSYGPPPSIPTPTPSPLPAATPTPSPSPAPPPRSPAKIRGPPGLPPGRPNVPAPRSNVPAASLRAQRAARRATLPVPNITALSPTYTSPPDSDDYEDQHDELENNNEEEDERPRKRARQAVAGPSRTPATVDAPELALRPRGRPRKGETRLPRDVAQKESARRGMQRLRASYTEEEKMLRTLRSGNKFSPFVLDAPVVCPAVRVADLLRQQQEDFEDAGDATEEDADSDDLGDDNLDALDRYGASEADLLPDAAWDFSDELPAASSSPPLSPPSPPIATSSILTPSAPPRARPGHECWIPRDWTTSRATTETPTGAITSTMTIASTTTIISTTTITSSFLSHYLHHASPLLPSQLLGDADVA
ncbi:hypothetical protein BDZ89DRAFT_1137556 [Hymenopellis radicata]|nr:hypothetical protein BDZ89DRAFT_1137556 [Hymenopellis radicata]